MSKIDVVDFNGPSGLGAAMPQVQPLSPCPEFAPEEYRAELADLHLTEAQETEILETLWSIMGHFARLGYAVDVCGLILEEFNEASAPDASDGNLVPSTNMESASEPNGGSA